MKTRQDIVNNWLPRYTGQKLDQFGNYILLTNFSNYVHMFAEWNGVEIMGEDGPTNVQRPMILPLSILVWAAPVPLPSWICYLPLIPKPYCFWANVVV